MSPVRDTVVSKHRVAQTPVTHEFCSLWTTTWSQANSGRSPFNRRAVSATGCLLYTSPSPRDRT